MIIDLHAHALNERFIVDLAKSPVAGLRSERDSEGLYIILSISSGAPATIGRAR
jgi:aminocarboxymuconate-semialdehyde decarboxylase